MRRRDREVSEPEELLRIMEGCDVVRLGIWDGERPYIVPLNFALTVEAGRPVLWFHSAARGKKLDLLRRADFIFRDEIARAGLAGTMDQYFAVLTNLRSVGVMGDGRTYDYALALRSVTTSDFMTADWTRIPYEVLDRVSVRVVNEVPHINRVLYDVTSKPPATIEYE